MSKPKRTDDITSFEEDWGGSPLNSTPASPSENNLMPYSGRAIQKFIKDNIIDHKEYKIGFHAPYSLEGEVYHDRAFASEENYILWLKDPDTYRHLVLSDRILPIEGGGLPTQLRMVIDTSNDPFIAFGETKQIRCYVFRGTEDMTYRVTKWSVIRDSGSPTEDEIWGRKPKALNFNGSLDICFTAKENDLGNIPELISTTFTFKAEFSDTAPVYYQLAF